ncbi:ubiquitin-like protein Pup [Zafaria sp. Z1313]|uniref:ubiquitin-like protein Pup n=1 Tax=unclassified Zafaria TaxID=2828765 RepID=UPI002E7855E2|nr:ubiquitin-like protein Pup [Zafaria sp. J156]MEE1621212.1 ubiquitin-like protein Pup [Zafaria sp. J156]
MAQEHIKPQPTRSTQEQEEPPVPAAAPQAQAQTQGTDDLLDEIDSVLEQNAEEFVRGFVQKGGQ